MAPQKSPAFQFYPKDFMAGTATMSLQEVGAYMRLLCYAWDAGSVPADPHERARILGCAKAQERDLWKKVGQKFVLQNDVYLNERMEEERQKQSEYRRRQSDRGKASAEARTNQRSNAGSTSVPTPVEPRPVDSGLEPEGNSSSSSSSSSSKELAKNASSSRAMTLIKAGESVDFDRKHGRHLVGFCDWVCFPMELVDRFANKIPGSDDGLKRAEIKAWAEHIREQWSNRIVGDGSDYEFWTNRWTETHGGSRPANATLKAAQAAKSIDEAFR